MNAILTLYSPVLISQRAKVDSNRFHHGYRMRPFIMTHELGPNNPSASDVDQISDARLVWHPWFFVWFGHPRGAWTLETFGSSCALDPRKGHGHFTNDCLSSFAGTIYQVG